MKKIISLVLSAILVAGLLTACSSTSNTKASGWDYIKKNGTLVIGLDDTFAPMGFRDTNGTLVGFDIDLATEVSKVLGVNVKFQPIDWKAKELELSSKRIDCIWNGMSATPERQKSMALSDKYLNNKIIIMSLKPDVKINTVADLKNYKLGTQSDSAALETMQANSEFKTFESNIKEYADYDKAILDMKAGRVDAIVIDEVLGNYKNTKMTEKLTTQAFNFGDDFYAVGCRKADTDVAQKINDAFKTLKDNGKAAEISKKWFGKDVFILEGYTK